MVVIRLSRGGAKKRPVLQHRRRRQAHRAATAASSSASVSTTRSPRTSEQPLRIAQDRLTYWRSVGAQPSPTVERLVKQAEAATARAGGRDAAALPRRASCADAALPADAIEVGRIADAWGIKGWFKVLPHSARPEALFSSKRWFLQPPESGRGSRLAAAGCCCAMREAKEHFRRHRRAGATTSTTATPPRRCAGARVFVPRSQLSRPPAPTSTTGST